MELFYGTDKKSWNDFIVAAGERQRPAVGAEFLQSWQWGEILEAAGEEIKRVGIKNRDGVVVALATLIKKPLGAGYFYWSAPRGPIVDPGASEVNEAGEFLATALNQENQRALFLRLEPANISQENFKLFPLEKTINQQPGQTLILDLHPRSDELLAAMHQKTRYNLRLAEKKGVRIREGRPEEFSEFWRLLARTGERDRFRLHPAGHYKNLLQTAPALIKLFFAEQGGHSIAAGIFSFWGGRATYLHGASDDEFRSLMAPYLLQWSVIRRAQDEGYGYYDFNGIDGKKWPGVTRFKLGFGGRVVTYPGTYDLVFQPAAYRLYNLVRAMRRRF